MNTALNIKTGTYDIGIAGVSALCLCLRLNNVMQAIVNTALSIRPGTYTTSALPG